MNNIDLARHLRLRLAMETATRDALVNYWLFSPQFENVSADAVDSVLKEFVTSGEVAKTVRGNKYRLVEPSWEHILEEMSKVDLKPYPRALTYEQAAEIFSKDFSTEQIERALARIRDVRLSDRYGWAVKLRPDLGDNRSASGSHSYWPMQKCECDFNCRHRSCRCYARKAHGDCSHRLAVMIHRVWLYVLYATYRGKF